MSTNQPQSCAETQQADYALSIKNSRKAFIKVVKPKENLDKYQEKVFEYAAKKGVDFAILTNGVVWWLYLSSAKGSALQNRFVVMDFLKQNAAEIDELMTAFLKRDEIAKDSAVKKAGNILKIKLQQAAQKAFPEAWFQILSEPNEALIRLIGETAEKICGVAAEREAIVKFLRERLKQPQPIEAAAPHSEEKALSGSEKTVSTSLLEEKTPHRAEKAAATRPTKEKASPRREQAAPPVDLEEILEPKIDKAMPIAFGEKAVPEWKILRKKYYERDNTSVLFH
jgi:predicted type IV restriction endonuclease